MPIDRRFERASDGFPAAIAGDSRRQSPIALLAAVLLLLCWPPARAADIAGSTDSRPIAVTAQSGIEWQKEAQVYVARGNAVATRGTTQVHADTLTAHYRPAKGAEGGNEVYRLDADGHVVISNGADTVIGDQAVYDVGQQIAVITGKDLKLTTPTDVVTARDSLEWYDPQQVAVARGDAVAVRGDRRIRADVLTAHMVKNTPPDAVKTGAPSPTAKPGTLAPTAKHGTPATTMQLAAAATSAKPAGSTPAPGKQSAGAAASQPGTSAGEGEDSRISRIDAQGNVVVSTPTDVARGDLGVYDAQTDLATLLGNVTITRGQNVIHGPYAVVDLKTNVSRMMNLAAAPGKPAQPVEGIFVRQDATGAASGSGKTGKGAPTPAPKP
jgi:lipopolysaccharide export system protein LptA